MKLLDLIFKALVTANLLALNLVFFGAYQSIRSKLMLFKTDISLQVEERLTEEFGYITKDMEAMKSELLKSQEKLIPKGGKVTSGMPLF
jgi:hypothetical protein